MSYSGTNDCLTLKGMQFHTCIGVFPHEHELPQPVELDLTVEIERMDDGAIVDYAILYSVVQDVMQAPHIGYIETIADRVAARVLEVSGVTVAHVAVRKPHVPLPGPLAYTEIRITRAKSSDSTHR